MSSPNTPIPSDGINAFKLSLVSSNVSHLMGEVLTVIDASTEGAKNKAMKDLIRTIFDKQHSWFYELSTKEQLASDDEEQKFVFNDWAPGLVPCDTSVIYRFK